MNLRYRSPPGPIIDVAPSRLDVGINGIYLNSFSLGPNEQRDSWLSRLVDFNTGRPDARVDIPSYNIYGYNDVQFYFDARPLHRGDCVAIPNDLRMSVDPDSTIDLSRGYRFAQMPNLQYFVNSGFPFTRMADLSETAVVVPDRPSGVEMSSFLNLMGRLGALTGYPTIRMTVVKPDGVAAVADRDILMIGTMQRLQGAAELLRKSPVSLSGNRLSVSIPTSLDSIRRLFGDRAEGERSRVAAALQSSVSEGTTALVGSESPLGRGRSLVAVLAASPQALEGAVAAMRDDTQASLIQGDLALLTGGKVTSYRVTEPYTVGTLPLWLYPSYVLRDQPYLVVILMLGGCILLGLAIYWAMRRRAGTRLQQRPNSRPVAR
jgi:cellulose synthase (UDP-forming)